MASAMVPGPAFVTRQSAAPMYSCMLATKPRITGENCCLPSQVVYAGHFRSSRARFTSSFLPQTTTNWPTPVLASISPMAMATCPKLPKPSPPPMSSTTSGLCVGMRPSSSCRCCLGRRSGSQKPSRTGRPQRCIRLLSTPCSRASCWISALGTKTRSTRGSNQDWCAVPRSVTTVATGTMDRPWKISSKASMTKWLTSGCTESTRSTPCAMVSVMKRRTSSRLWLQIILKKTVSRHFMWSRSTSQNFL
mmetsp:Transcript_104750/g.333243  ORF Transcript_104750/g.333243 Transcript_104750/m.333243 type:complete len:249 (+) Transcript_104750:708-1454(+)